MARRTFNSAICCSSEDLRQEFLDASAARQAQPHRAGLWRDVNSELQKRTALALEGDPFGEMLQRHALDCDLNRDAVGQLGVAGDCRRERPAQLAVARAFAGGYCVKVAR